MPNKFDALFAEHAKPHHCCKADIHAQLTAILAVGTLAQKQVLEYRSALLLAHLEDDSLAGKTEHIDQTLGATEREAAAFVAAGRKLAQAFSQLDRYMADQKVQIGKVAP